MLKRIDVSFDDDELSLETAEEDLDLNTTLPSLEGMELDAHAGESDGAALYYEAVAGHAEDFLDEAKDLDVDFADDEPEDIGKDHTEEFEVPDHIRMSSEKEEAGYDGDEVRAYINSLDGRLLTKEEEQELAFVKLHADHDRRLLVFSNDLVARACLKLLLKLSRRESREDRVLDVAVTNKKQRADALAVVDLHVPTIQKLLSANISLVKIVMNRSASPEERKECLVELHRNRRKVAILIHETKLRSEYVDREIERLRKLSKDPDKSDGPVNSLNEEISYPQTVLQLGESPKTVQRRLKRIDEITIIRDEAKKPLVQFNLRFAMSCAKKYRNRGLSFIDLIQEANTGLMRAVEKFDPRLGNRLTTYAKNWIEQALKKAVQAKSRTIKVTPTGIKEIKKFREMKRDLTEKLHREPNSDELYSRFREVFKGAKTERKAAELFTWVSANSNSMGALDAVAGSDEGQTFGKFIQRDYRRDETVSTADEYEKEESISDALRVLEALRQEDARGAKIVELRLGLFGHSVHTLKEVGEAIGVTKERIRQIEKKFLEKVRNAILDRERHDDE